MQDGEPVRIPRWEYRLVWRYGPLLLIVVGLGLLAAGLAGVSSTAISATSLVLGFASIVSGAVLPRIDGKFKATARGEVSGQLLAPHVLDYTVSGPAVAPVASPDEPAVGREAVIPAPPSMWLEDPHPWRSLTPLRDALPVHTDAVIRMSSPHFVLARDGVVRAPSPGGGRDSEAAEGDAPPAVALGDVWDAIKARLGDEGGFLPLATTLAKSYLRAPDRRLFTLPKPGLESWRPASPDLLQLLSSWGTVPAASGKYPRPAHAPADERPVTAEMDPPDLQLNGQ